MLAQILALALVPQIFIGPVVSQSYNNGNATTTAQPSTELRVLTFNNPPFLTVSADGNTLSGFDFDVLLLLAQRANFTYRLYLQPDDQSGSLQPDGTWNGMIGQIIAKNYDVCGDNTITAARTRVVDFTTPIYSSQLRILINTQDNISSVNYLVRANSSKASFLQNSKDPRWQAIWKNIVATNGLVSSNAAGVNKVLAGGFAFVQAIPDLNSFLVANPGKLALTPDVLYSTYGALVTQLGSPLGKRLSVAISQINESGELQALIVKYGL